MLKKRMTYLWSVAAFMAAMGLGGFSLAGDLEPSAAPGPTMRTLEELHPAWNKILTTDRFEVVMNNEAVLDKETGLVWEKLPQSLASNWVDAAKECNNRIEGGRYGWRLPAVEELASLVDESRTSAPYIPNELLDIVGLFFPTTLWSSSASREGPIFAQGVFFGEFGPGGGKRVSGNITKETILKLWCVRGGAGSVEIGEPQVGGPECKDAWNKRLSSEEGERFDLVLEGAAVLDKETCLVWALEPITLIVNWAAAHSLCIRSEVGRRGGWRLPTIEEGNSLRDTVNTNPALPTDHPFTDVLSAKYWSSTTDAANTSLAWVIRFGGGSVFTSDKTTTKNVWCVRGGSEHDGQ